MLGRLSCLFVLKTFWGMPMRWEARNMLKNLWNPDDERVFPPRYFGVGEGWPILGY